MAGFHDIIGHEKIKEHLQKAIGYQRVSHAYILSGEEGMGRKTIAKAFAMTLLCEKHGTEPCMECHSCKQFLSGNHPDVIWVTHEKPASIGVDDVRIQINDTVSIRPYSSPYKIYLVDEAEKMTVQAQNALLKTIEEPPAYAVLVLITTNPEVFLPTILSRCIQLKLRPLKDSVVSDYLTEKMGVSDGQADIYAAFARGNLGKAIHLASSEEFALLYREVLTLLKNIKDMDIPMLLDYIRKLQEDNLEKWVPQVNGKVISYDCFYIGEDTYSGTVISSFDVDKPDKTIDAKCIMNNSGEVYVSSNAMYLYHSDWSASRELTKISKISFEDGVMKTGETTSVNGYLNDKFAINEQGGYLYVLPTSNTGSQPVNSLHVLDKDMNEVGVINEIARGESIYAARFVGKYVYFITYRQTDPLFVADISDPTAPKLLGELEVSGFSEYLHMWDDTHVLGIGYGDSQQSKIKLTMFDVSDPTKPVEVNQKLIDSSESWSNEFVYNYKAILADPEKNLIGFTANDYYLFSYDSENGFSLLEQQALTYKNTEGYRGIYKDNDFYVAGNGEIKHFKLAE